MNQKEFIHNRLNCNSNSWAKVQFDKVLNQLKSDLNPSDEITYDLNKASYDQSDSSWYYIPGEVTTAEGDLYEVRFYLSESERPSVMITSDYGQGDYSIDQFVEFVDKHRATYSKSTSTH